jgi:hypothetical protein
MDTSVPTQRLDRARHVRNLRNIQGEFVEFLSLRTLSSWRKCVGLSREEVRRNGDLVITISGSMGLVDGRHAKNYLRPRPNLGQHFAELPMPDFGIYMRTSRRRPSTTNHV